MALTDKLSAIGNAIREKTGGTELLTLDAMPTAIASITSGGGSIDLPTVTITSGYEAFTGSCGKYILENLPDKITTSRLTGLYGMFANNSNLKNIPFAINLAANSGVQTDYMFQNCYYLNQAPMFSGSNAYLESCTAMFYECWRMVSFPDGWGATMRLPAPTYNGKSQCFYRCRSLRKIPDILMKQLKTDDSYNESQPYYQGFFDCWMLEEIVNLPVSTEAELYDDAFYNAFYNCHRLSRLTFETNTNGTPKVAKWTNQVINLACGIGFERNNNITSSSACDNSGLTLVTDISYIGDPNTYTNDYSMSQFSHTAMVEFINSLPDTAAFGGVNSITIPFGLGDANLEGGASALTEEEIAVAAAKGWTINFVSYW